MLIVTATEGGPAGVSGRGQLGGTTGNARGVWPIRPCDQGGSWVRSDGVRVIAGGRCAALGVVDEVMDRSERLVMVDQTVRQPARLAAGEVRV